MKEKTIFRNTFQNIGDKRRPLLALALVLVAGLSVLNSGCAPTNDLSCPGSDANFLFDKAIFNGVRFRVQLAEQNGLVPSDHFWFAANDNKTVEYGWNESFFRFRDADTNSCSYSPPTENCIQCDICANSCTNGLAPNLVLQDVTFGDLFEIREQGGPLLLQQVTNPYSGCLMRTGNPPFLSFAPQKDTNYILWMKDFCGNTLSGQTMLTKVMSTGRKLRQKLERYDDTADPALRYRFKMPEVDGKLRENFSPNIKITRVRILRGKKDPATGEEMVMADPKVLPSRIMFLPDFLEANINDSSTARINRCSLDASIENGDFDLRNCRDGGGGFRDFTTASTSLTPTFMQGRVDENQIPTYRETLTWVIEYKMEFGLTELTDFEGVPNDASDDTYPVLEWEFE